MEAGRLRAGVADHRHGRQSLLSQPRDRPREAIRQWLKRRVGRRQSDNEWGPSAGWCWWAEAARCRDPDHTGRPGRVRIRLVRHVPRHRIAQSWAGKRVRRSGDRRALRHPRRPRRPAGDGLGAGRRPRRRDRFRPRRVRERARDGGRRARDRECRRCSRDCEFAGLGSRSDHSRCRRGCPGARRRSC